MEENRGTNYVLGVITVLPVFPYSRQPDVPYVRPDTPLANAPAMLFKDSFTVSSGPTSPVAVSNPSSEKGVQPQPKRGPIENTIATAYRTDRSDAVGKSEPVSSYYLSVLFVDCRKRS